MYVPATISTSGVGPRPDDDLAVIVRVPFEKALRASTTHQHDYLGAYTSDLGTVIDMESIRGAGIRLEIDPLGGAGVHYWERIAERDGLNLTVVNDTVDPTFRFMTWTGTARSADHLRRILEDAQAIVDVRWPRCHRPERNDGNSSGNQRRLVEHQVRGVRRATAGHELRKRTDLMETSVDATAVTLSPIPATRGRV